MILWLSLFALAAFCLLAGYLARMPQPDVQLDFVSDECRWRWS